MNAPTRTGIKTAIESAWAKLPEIIVATLVALATVSFGLWLDCRDVQRDIRSILAEQEPDRLCERIGSCRTSGENINSFWELRSELRSIQQKLEERGIRIATLETQVRELTTSPKARPDPFTGSMGRELEARIRELEEKNGH